MTADTLNGDDLPTTGPGVPDLDRYRHIALEEAELLVYDVDEDAAWLQSDRSVDLEAWR